jgi:hypothetical protein
MGRAPQLQSGVARPKTAGPGTVHYCYHYFLIKEVAESPIAKILCAA